jgi:hypothetical protein
MTIKKASYFGQPKPMAWYSIPKAVYGGRGFAVAADGPHAREDADHVAVDDADGLPMHNAAHRRSRIPARNQSHAHRCDMAQTGKAVHGSYAPADPRDSLLELGCGAGESPTQLLRDLRPHMPLHIRTHGGQCCTTGRTM